MPPLSATYEPPLLRPAMTFFFAPPPADAAAMLLITTRLPLRYAAATLIRAFMPPLPLMLSIYML